VLPATCRAGPRTGLSRLRDPDGSSVDDAIAGGVDTPVVIFTSFGDMMRCPGSRGNLLKPKRVAPDVRFVYSPLDALRMRRDA
jgi:hydrogenase expression/formation protein HypD